MTETLTDVASLFAEAAGLAASALDRNSNRSGPVVHRLSPLELQESLGLELPAKGQGMDAALELARKTLHYSVATGHPRFLNQLFGGHDAPGILGEWICALTNTSMYTYEAAPVGTVVELALLKRMSEYVGFECGEGVFAPGGSIANLMAMLTARHHYFPHVKHDGLRPDDQPVMFVSAEAHYSIARSAMVAGIGTSGCIEVPTDDVGRMLPAELEALVEEAIRAGKRPFMVAATAGTTVPGAFDPVDAIADIAKQHDLWLHVDGSYGGSVLFSAKHRQLLKGIERADSVTWNPHKMMGVPLSCAALLMKQPGALVATLGMNADYLFHADAEADWDLGDRSLQCGRRVDALKLWFSWQALGDEGYEQRVDHLFELAEEFREMVRSTPGFRLIREQESTNVCFRYLPEEQRELKGQARDRCEHEATLRIRAIMANEGSFLVNYATLDGAATFRLVASNPQTNSEDLRALLARIQSA